MDQLLDTHGEIIMTFLLPKLLPSSFVSFMIVSDRTYELTKTYLATSNVRHGFDTVAGVSPLTGKMQNTYVNGMPHGKFVGPRNRCSYYDGKLTGRYIKHVGTDVIISHYSNGLKHGHETGKDSCGRKFYECNYYNDKMHGLYLDYGSDGKVIGRTRYIEGKLHGKCVSVLRNGVEKVTYRNGVKHGKYHISIGDKVVAGRYVNGLQEGVWEEQLHGKQITVIKYYRRGLLHSSRIIDSSDTGTSVTHHYNQLARQN